MIYERNGVWRIEGRGRSYATREEAMKAAGLVEVQPDDVLEEIPEWIYPDETSYPIE
jgi:hypothetical protein